MAGSYDAGGVGRLELAKLMKDLAKVDVAAQKAVNRRLRLAAKPIADAARVNAAEVMPNHPVKVGTRVRRTGRNGASVKVVVTPVDGNDPVPGLLERGNRGDSATIRHPTFGHDPWVDQPTKPYLQPALDEHREEAIKQTTDVVTDVLAALKFR